MKAYIFTNKNKNKYSHNAIYFSVIAGEIVAMFYNWSLRRRKRISLLLSVSMESAH